MFLSEPSHHLSRLFGLGHGQQQPHQVAHWPTLGVHGHGSSLRSGQSKLSERMIGNIRPSRFVDSKCCPPKKDDSKNCSTTQKLSLFHFVGRFPQKKHVPFFGAVVAKRLSKAPPRPPPAPRRCSWWRLQPAPLAAREAAGWSST